MTKYMLRFSGMMTLLAVFACFFPAMSTQADRETKPNIIFILADDLGYGDLGVTGQKKIDTPNLDKLAREGMLFTNHYSGATVCAPSRSTILTGLHTGHTPIRGNSEVQPEGQFPLTDSIATLPRIMKRAGYATGAFGKWGLGFVGSTGDPNNQGFDEFFGYNCQRYAHRYYPTYLWKNSDKYPLAGNDWTRKATYAPDVIQEAALGFIEKNSDKPFFMYVPMVIPHAEMATDESSETFKKYRQRFGEEKEFKAPPGWDYGPDIVISGYQSVKYPLAIYATMVEHLDTHVGQIVAKLEAMGIRENTLIIFGSDNGPHLEGGYQPDFFDSNGIYRGYKRDLYEGGIKTSLIANWPGKVQAGSVSDHISAYWDLLPTFAELAGTTIADEIDGISMVPTLLGNATQAQHKYLYWEFVEQGGKQAIRMGNWKAVRLNLKKDPNPPTEIYNLRDDPSETKNVADQHPDLVREFNRLFGEAHRPNAVFQLF